MYESTQEIREEMLEVVSKSSRLKTALTVCGLVMNMGLLAKILTIRHRQTGVKGAEDYHQIALGDNDYLL